MMEVAAKSFDCSRLKKEKLEFLKALVETIRDTEPRANRCYQYFGDPNVEMPRTPIADDVFEQEEVEKLKVLDKAREVTSKEAFYEILKTLPEGKYDGADIWISDKGDLTKAKVIKKNIKKKKKKTGPPWVGGGGGWNSSS